MSDPSTVAGLPLTAAGAWQAAAGGHRASVFGDLSSLRRAAQTGDPGALREAARQFESLFARELIASMRAASFGDSLFGSDQQDFYQGLFDDQLAVELTRGRGLGLAEMLVEQLARAGLASPAPAAPAPAGAANGAGAPPQAHVSREDFVREMWPHAEEAGRELGVDPRALLAQAALESGWGRSVPTGADGRPSFNLFGIKAGGRWHGPAVAARTLEFEDGVAVSRVERFRAYGSPAESFRDHAALLRSEPRYADALGTGADIEAFAGALQRGGYATDPDYAAKLVAVARSLEELLPSAAAARADLKLAQRPPITPGGGAG